MKLSKALLLSLSCLSAAKGQNPRRFHQQDHGGYRPPHLHEGYQEQEEGVEASPPEGYLPRRDANNDSPVENRGPLLTKEEEQEDASSQQENEDLLSQWTSSLKNPQQRQNEPDVEVFDCDEVFTPLDTTLFIQWEGDSIDDTDAFEDAIVEVYNNVSFSLCDAPLFRRFFSASTISFLGSNSVAIVVEGGCNDCSSDSPLFSTPEIPIIGGGDVVIGRQGEGPQECVCASDVEQQRRAPSFEEFQAGLNDRLDAITITEVDELASVDCADNVTQFTSIIYAEFLVDGTFPSDLEIQALEENVRETYNLLSFLKCDEFFRSIQSVELEFSQELLLEGRRSLQITNTNFEGVNTTDSGESQLLQSSLRVVGECRNCPVSDAGSFALFDSAFRRSLSQVREGKHLSRFLQTPEDTGGCTCLAGAEAQPLLVDDFLLSFNERLLDSEDIDAVQSLQGIVEGQQVSCGAPTAEDFRSDVYVDLIVDLTSITDEDVVALEDSFQTAYNYLSFLSCDANARKVVDAELRIVFDGNSFPNRRLSEMAIAARQSDSVNTTEDYSQVPAFFRVQGECRQCAVSEAGYFNLFDDSFRRRLQVNQEVNPFDPYGFQTIDENTCICPAGSEPVLGLGPTTTSFKSIFSDVIDQELITIGSDVDTVVEGQQVLCGQNLTNFNLTLIGELEIEPDELTDERISELETRFLNTYNNLTFDVCDSFFRTVNAVQLTMGVDVIRRLQADEGASNVNTTDEASLTEVKIRVTGSCRGCPVSETGTFNLFDDGFRRSLELRAGEVPNYSQEAIRGLQEALAGLDEEYDETACICPIGTEPGEEGPTVDQFIEDFNEGDPILVRVFPPPGIPEATPEPTQTPRAPPLTPLSPPLPPLSCVLTVDGVTVIVRGPCPVDDGSADVPPPSIDDPPPSGDGSGDDPPPSVDDPVVDTNPPTAAPTTAVPTGSPTRGCVASSRSCRSTAAPTKTPTKAPTPKPTRYFMSGSGRPPSTPLTLIPNTLPTYELPTAPTTSPTRTGSRISSKRATQTSSPNRMPPPISPPLSAPVSTPEFPSITFAQQPIYPASQPVFAPLFPTYSGVQSSNSQPVFAPVFTFPEITPVPTVRFEPVTKPPTSLPAPKKAPAPPN